MALNLSFVNEKEINLLYKSLDIKEHIKPTSKLTLEASLTGPKVSLQMEDVEKDFDVMDNMYAVWDYLKNNDLIKSRPNSFTEFRKNKSEFVFETVKAKKFYFTKSQLSEISALNHLVVWVAEPDFDKLSDDELIYNGTFLYLIETQFENQGLVTGMSGRSALQVLFNLVHGKPFFNMDKKESLGRLNTDSPSEKLLSIGAMYLHEEEISSLYRIKYMSDEQAFIHNQKRYGCNDLLAYPIFIS